MENIKTFLDGRLAYAEKYKGDYHLVHSFEHQAFGVVCFYAELSYRTGDMEQAKAIEVLWDEYKAKFDALK